MTDMASLVLIVGFSLAALAILLLSTGRDAEKVAERTKSLKDRYLPDSKTNDINRVNDALRANAFRRRKAAIKGFATLYREAGLTFEPRNEIVWVLLVATILGGCLHFVVEQPIGLSAAASIGLALPARLFAVKLKRKKRIAKFLNDFPDALDLIIRSVRSGLPVAEAIRSIGAEFDEPIGPIFADISNQVQIGKDPDQALLDASASLNTPEFRFFVIALSIQRETGGNLTEILTNLTNMIRGRQQLRLKIKAMSSEARASAMIIGALPFIMAVLIYLINPDYISAFVFDPRGQVMLGCGAASMAFGIFVMNRMIKFDV